MAKICSLLSKDFGKIEFIDRNSQIYSSNFKTVIIGENGTGKTRLLNEVVGGIRNINAQEVKRGEGYSGHFEFYDGDSTAKFDRIIAISTSINDKLPFSDNEKSHDGFYHYCGIRETSNATWTSSLMRKTLDNLLVCIDMNKSGDVQKILEFLGLSRRFRITFKLKKISKFDINSCTALELHDFVRSYSTNTSRMQVDKIREFSIVQAKSIIKNFMPLISKSYKNECFIEVVVSNWTEGFVDAYENLDILRRVGLIGSVSLSLSRNHADLDYSFVDASSGEAQLLYSLTAFIRYVENNSLVIIDEPEISLHPNWQIKYFSLLNSILKSVNDCHVIIATHSHFLISELDKDSSSLVSLRADKGGIQAEHIYSSTLGWSPESILYRVFNVRTFNSAYLDSDLRRAHSMLFSSECDFDELQALNKKFKSLVLDSSDPLNKFIETIDEYLNDN